jgi:coenzyme Q-binding protein COQ10
VFRPAADGGCEIDFSVDFEFRNRVFEGLAGMFFHEAFHRMVSAFESRAAAVYGVSSGSGISSSSATSAA